MIKLPGKPDHLFIPIAANVLATAMMGGIDGCVVKADVNDIDMYNHTKITTTSTCEIESSLLCTIQKERRGRVLVGRMELSRRDGTCAAPRGRAGSRDPGELAVIFIVRRQMRLCDSSDLCDTFWKFFRVMDNFVRPIQSLFHLSGRFIFFLHLPRGFEESSRLIRSCRVTPCFERIRTCS